MLSRSTPDLREDSSACSPASLPGDRGWLAGERPPGGGGGEASSPAPGPSLGGGAGTKGLIPRPSSAPSTRFSDCDSAFEDGCGSSGGGGESDPAAELGDILSVLSVDGEARAEPAGAGSSGDAERLPADRREVFRERQEPLGAFGSYIPAIAEMSGEESDTSHRGGRPAPVMGTEVSPPRPSILGRATAPSAGGAHHHHHHHHHQDADPKPRRVQCLRTPLVYVSLSSDDTSSDSSDNGAPAAGPPPSFLRRGGRRHSLASTAPDQITRMLLSHRRGSFSGAPAPPCAECSCKNLYSSRQQPGRPVERQRSVDGARPSTRSSSAQPDSRGAPLQGSSSGPALPRSKAPPMSNSPNPSAHLHPVCPEPAGDDGAVTAGESSARTVQPARQRCPSPTRSGRLSPRPVSPGRPRSPGLHRRRSASPRDEIEMILCRSPAHTPPASPSGSSSASLPPFPRPQDAQQSRQSPPSIKTTPAAVHPCSPESYQPQPRARSRSPRPKQERYNGSAAQLAPNNEQLMRSRNCDPHQRSLQPHDRPVRSRSRSPNPHSLKPDRRTASPSPSSLSSSSVHPKRDRSPRPSGQDRRSSRRGSGSLIAVEPTLPVGRDSRRPSLTPSVPEGSDGGSVADLERFLQGTDRRRRRGSRGKVPAVMGGGLPVSATASGAGYRRSRRSSICISHPAKETAPPGPEERVDIEAKLRGRQRRRSSWAGGGEPLLPMTPVSALAFLRESSGNVEEETELTRDPYALTLHFITDPGQSHPLRRILRPLIESVVPKLKLFNFVERSESVARELRASRDGEPGEAGEEAAGDGLVPTLGVVLLLQEEFGMERILEAQKYLRSEPWRLHHRGQVGTHNVPYPTNNQDFYAHCRRDRPGSALWAVRQVHFGKDRLRFQLFVSDEMWADSISFYGLLLSRPTHVRKEDFCYFLVFCSRSLNLEVQLALKKLPPGFRPQFVDSTILQFKVGDMGQLVPLMPRVCIPISDKRWQTADPDGNKVLLFKDGGDSPTIQTAAATDEAGAATTAPPPATSGRQHAYPPVGALSRRDRESPAHKFQDHAGYFDDWIQESSLVSAV